MFTQIVVLLLKRLKRWLFEKGIPSSQTATYNPQGNGQVERYNGIIWKSALLALKLRDLPIIEWERILPDALHSTRSLLCTATNATPHERLFNFQRRSANVSSMPSRLMQPGTVLRKRNVRRSKYEPLVDEVELVESESSLCSC